MWIIKRLIIKVTENMGVQQLQSNGNIHIRIKKYPQGLRAFRLISLVDSVDN